MPLGNLWAWPFSSGLTASVLHNPPILNPWNTEKICQSDIKHRIVLVRNAIRKWLQCLIQIISIKYLCFYKNYSTCIHKLDQQDKPPYVSFLCFILFPYSLAFFDLWLLLTSLFGCLAYQSLNTSHLLILPSVNMWRTNAYGKWCLWKMSKSKILTEQHNNMQLCDYRE